MRFDYTWLCNCGEEGMNSRLAAARAEAHRHLAVCFAGKDVFIDQYDTHAGELSDRFWKITK